MKGKKKMKFWTRNQLRRLRIFFMLNSDKRNQYIRKHHIFYEMGENVFFQPRIMPTDPHLIKLHNNIVITSNVTFVTHDIFHLGLNNLNKGHFNYNQGCIEIMDNVFIGCNTTILGNVRIGSNVIIGAGSVVTKDIPSNSVVVGNPAKVIGTFEEFLEKRSLIKEEKDLGLIWQKFAEERKKN